MAEAAFHTWRAGPFDLALGRPLVMGILNVTPDSFSDGGAHDRIDLAIEHARRMLDEGADIIDVGGESTRPGAAEVSLEQEIERVLPVLSQLTTMGVPVSVDTRHVEVAEACVEAGACIINDVSGFRDEAMVKLAARHDVGVVIMHMLGEPGTMQADPVYTDVVAEVGEFLDSSVMSLTAAGVSRQRICIDPGIGFGKTLEHNLQLLRGIDEFATRGFPVLIGASRKRMIGEALGIDDPGDRLEGSLAVAAWSVTHGARIIRAHDVRETVRVVRMTARIASN